MKKTANSIPAAVATKEVSAGEISAGFRLFLYVTAVIAGAAVLIVEILGAKMLCPFFGASHFVWTAQIGVTLVSLAAGYYMGGRFADRSQGLGQMYAFIAAAAVYLSLTIPLVGRVSMACLEVRLALGSFLAALFLFAIPLMLLATVGPFLVRQFTSNVSSVGSQVGRLSALSTLGSVGGTVLIGYLMIPFLPNSVTMLVTAFVLLSLSACYFLFFRANGPKAKPLTMLALAAIGSLGLAFFGMRAEGKTVAGLMEIERINSNFGTMQVLDTPDHSRRYYLNDYLIQNTYAPASKQSISTFTYMLHLLAKSYSPRLENALCIGMGVGIVPMRMASEGTAVDVVEINPAVVGLAERHFDFEPQKTKLIIDDGRHYLNECKKRYDAIVLDAFLGDSSPSHLMTAEAFAAMRDCMTEKGVLVINSFGHLTPGKNFFAASLEKTLRKVFSSVQVHTIHDGAVFFVASREAQLVALHAPDFEQVHPMVRAEAAQLFESTVQMDLQDGLVLTDDYNPVDYYDAANREKVRYNLTSWIRKQ